MNILQTRFWLSVLGNSPSILFILGEPQNKMDVRDWTQPPSRNFMNVHHKSVIFLLMNSHSMLKRCSDFFYLPSTLFFFYCTAWWHSYTCMYTFFFSQIIMLHHKWLDMVPRLHSRMSLLIHSKGNSLHLLTPSSPSIPLPPPPTWQPQCIHLMHFFIYLFLSFCPFRATPSVYGGSQVRGPIETETTDLCHSHSNTGSELHLWPTLQLTATPNA